MSPKKKPFLIGLTGSIGMGKSTTAKMFAGLGLPVWDADAAVHRLYGVGGAAVVPMEKLNSDAIVDGIVSRSVLKAWIAQDDTALIKIESVVHPLVAADRHGFIDSADSDIVVLDIPLLFETGGESAVDVIVVVSAPQDIQRERVLARPGMTAAQFDSIRAKQLPDSEKRARADYVIETIELEQTRAAVQSCLNQIRKRLNDA